MRKKLLFLVLVIGFVKVSSAQAPNWLWAESNTGGSCNMDTKGLWAGSSGNIYSGGRFGGTLVLNGASASASGSEVFSAKMDSNGVFSWIKAHPYTNQNDYDYGFGADKYENTYVTGQTQGSNGLFVDKYNSAGTFVWSYAPPALSSNMGGYGKIGVDNSGNVYVTGVYSGSKNFGPNTLTSVSSSDMFLAKIDSNGNCKWAVSAGAPGQAVNGRGVAVDQYGGVYVCGSYNGTATFGSITLPANSGGDGFFIAKYDTAGNVQWVQHASNAGSNSGAPYWQFSAVVVDSCANVYVAGHYINSAQFGPFTLANSNSNYNIFVAKCHSDGNWEWAQGAGSTGNDEAWGLVLDKYSDVYISGYFTGNAQFGTQSVTTTGPACAFVAKYANSTGDVQWVQSVGGSATTYGVGLAIDNEEHCYITGSIGGSNAVFGPSTISALTGCGIFYAKLDAAPPARTIVPKVNTAYCPGSTLTLPFTITGTFNSGNVFTAQLSNDSGSFVSPVFLGDTTSANGGEITITIPANTRPGVNYSVRIISSSPATSSWSNGCGAYLLNNVYINTFPVTIGSGNLVAKVSNDTGICSGSFVHLHASGGSVYSWSPGATLNDSTSANPYAAPTSPQVYTVIVTTGGCGSDTAKVRVDVSPVTNISVSPVNPTACSGTGVQFTASGASSYTWMPASGLSCSTCSNPVANVQSTTIYTITGNGGACSNTFFDTVTVGNTAVGGFIGAVRDTICQGTPGNLSLTGSSGINLQWQSSPDEINFTNTGDTATKYKTTPLQQSTWYRVTVGSGNCSAISDTFRLYVPPALTAYFNSTQTSAGVIAFNSDSSGGGIRSYHWDFGDNSTSTEQDPVHTFTQDTTYYVCLTLYDGSNCSYTFCRYTDVTDGVPTISAAGNWVVYPNPFSEQLTVSSKQTNSHIQSVEIYDVLGQLVINKSIGSSANTSLQLDVSLLAKGMYYVMIKTSDANYVQKVVKQ